MTFYYAPKDDELIGNNMFHTGDYGPLAERDGDTLKIDVSEIMENGRGVAKLHEMHLAIIEAIEAHETG